MKANCVHCGTPDNECMDGVEMRGKACCGHCHVSHTHGKKAEPGDTGVVPDAAVLAAAHARWGKEAKLHGYSHRVQRTAEMPSFRAACQAVWDAAQATCSCVPWPPDGPSVDCTVHGAVRAFNLASAELIEARNELRILKDSEDAQVTFVEIERDAARAEVAAITGANVETGVHYGHVTVEVGWVPEPRGANYATSQRRFWFAAPEPVEWTGPTTEVRETVARRERVYMGPYGILPGACGAHPASGYTCTRLAGHSEPHVACNFKGEIVCVWAADDK